MVNMDTMIPPSLHFEATLNQEETGAILHINCQSDGKRAKWSKDKEEGSEQAKRVWLGKLGCLLKVHGNITCQCQFHSPVRTNTNLVLPPDIFNDPWSYRIADFPANYKLFVKERQTEGDNHPQKDHYLCGRPPPSPPSPPVHNITHHLFSGGERDYRSPQEFYPHLHWLLENAQGVSNPCICKYCDTSRTQEQINKIFPLPPSKENPKGPRGPKKQMKGRKHQGPKGVTIQRGMVANRNSITTGPVTTLGCYGEGQKVINIGHKTSHPFRS